MEHKVLLVQLGLQEQQQILEPLVQQVSVLQVLLVHEVLLVYQDLLNLRVLLAQEVPLA
jgi:hypothetical protein